MSFVTEHLTWIVPLSTIAGGAVTWIASQVWLSKKHESSERAEFITRVNEYSDRQDIRIKDRDEQIENLTKELIQARLQLSEKVTGIPPLEVIKSVIDADIGIMWVKRRVSDGKFAMVRVSEGYARLYLGGSPEIYDNLNDDQIWPKEVADLFLQADELVYKRQQGLEICEKVEGSPTKVRGYIRGRKYPLRIGAFDLVFGIGEHLSKEDAIKLSLITAKPPSKKVTKRSTG
jgi:hypothetical protein